MVLRLPVSTLACVVPEPTRLLAIFKTLSTPRVCLADLARLDACWNVVHGMHLHL